MVQRMDSTAAEYVSASFSPIDDVVIQVDAEVPVTIDVQVKMDASLNWAGAYSFRSDAEPVARLSKVPFMRFSMRGNTVGKRVQIWDAS